MERYKGIPNDAAVERVFSKSEAINVPVEIAVSEEIDEDTSLPSGRYLLKASLYRERTNGTEVVQVVQDSVTISCANRDSLSNLLRERVIPLYQDAISRLEAFSGGVIEDSQEQLESHSDSGSE